MSNDKIEWGSADQKVLSRKLTAQQMQPFWKKMSRRVIELVCLLLSVRFDIQINQSVTGGKNNQRFVFK
jgi:hypothetical protein